MRFADVRRRLTVLPERLPPEPRQLTPVVVAGPDGEPPRMPSFPSGPVRDAAVLVLIHPADGDEAHVVLTERSTGGHRHAGQVSLPGGAVDEGESLVDAALREAAEEVGLDPIEAGVEVLGTVAPIEVRVSGFRAHPVVAVAPRPPALVADGREVATVIHAPLSAFVPGAPIEIVTGERDGMRLRYGAYPVGGYLIWGATARILGGLGAILREPGAAR